MLTLMFCVLHLYSDVHSVIFYLGIVTHDMIIMNECVLIYRTYHLVSQGGLQFYLSEIGRQLVKAPLAAAISPYLTSLTHPTHA